MIPAALIPAITASLPLIEAAFKWVWSHLETPAEDLAWESIAAVLPAGTGTHVEPLFRAVWREYGDGELARAWADLSRKLAAGDELTRAHIEPIEDVTEDRLDTWDAKDGFEKKAGDLLWPKDETSGSISEAPRSTSCEPRSPRCANTHATARAALSRAHRYSTK